MEVCVKDIKSELKKIYNIYLKYDTLLCVLKILSFFYGVGVWGEGKAVLNW